MDWRCRRRIR